MVTCEDGPAALAFEESVLGGPATHALTHATLVGNSGDGLRVGAASATSLTVTNIITAFNDGYGINDVYLAPAVSYSAAWSNQAGDYANVNPWGANNNQQVDPFFIDYDPLDPCDYWNLALDRSQSSLVDAGSGTDLDGSVADMGYFGGPLAP